MGKSSINGPCSMAMLNNQRVLYIYTYIDYKPYHDHIYHHISIITIIYISLSPNDLPIKMFNCQERLLHHLQRGHCLSRSQSAQHHLECDPANKHKLWVYVWMGWMDGWDGMGWDGWMDVCLPVYLYS